MEEEGEKERCQLVRVVMYMKCKKGRLFFLIRKV